MFNFNETDLGSMLGYLMVHLPTQKKEVDVNALHLEPFELDKKYAKKWNAEHYNDFVILVKDGKRVNDSIYRVGGLCSKPDGENYFMLLKYVEAYYPKNIVGNRDPKHLDGLHCILDKNGVEKVIAKKSGDYLYLVKNSCIYTCKNEYYNIETGMPYCNSSNSIESSEFLFLEDRYSNEKDKMGVYKINKKDGSVEFFN